MRLGLDNTGMDIYCGGVVTPCLISKISVIKDNISPQKMSVLPSVYLEVTSIHWQPYPNPVKKFLDWTEPPSTQAPFWIGEQYLILGFLLNYPSIGFSINKIFQEKVVNFKSAAIPLASLGMKNKSFIEWQHTACTYSKTIRGSKFRFFLLYDLSKILGLTKPSQCLCLS